MTRLADISFGILLACLAFSVTAADSPDLQKPPTSPLAKRPALSRLLVDDSGRPITTKPRWRRKRDELKKKWLLVMGELPSKKAPLKAQVLATEDLPDFKRQHVQYQIEDGVFTDAYVLTPKNVKGKLPAVVVFHPTVSTHARQMAGIDESNPEKMHGVQLVKRGYLVLCPRCFIFADGAGYADHVRLMQARHPNWTGMARMTYDGVRAVDYLESLPNVDPRRIGGFGHSLGAKEVLYAAAFDERYQVAVFSEGGIGLGFSNWEAVWYLGAQIKQPNFALEHHQVLALIAPRAFLLLAGESADGDKGWPFIESVMPVYRLLDAEKEIGWLNHRQGHRYPPEAEAVAERFLDEHLKK